MPILTLPDVELFYQQRGAGPPALFIHGFALEHTMWLDQLTALAPLRRCVAIDLRGSGRSHIGLEPGRAMEFHGGDVLAVVKALGPEPVDLVGHSMGAHIALAAAAAAPRSVRSLALFGIMGRDEYRRGNTRPAAALMRPKEELAGRFASGMLAPAADLMARARGLAMTMTVDWAVVYPETAGPAAAAAGPLPPVPILFATGAHDVVTPPLAVARMARAHARATFIEVAGAGHLAPVENPLAVSSALAGFWRSGPEAVEGL